MVFADGIGETGAVVVRLHPKATTVVCDDLQIYCLFEIETKENFKI